MDTCAFGEWLALGAHCNEVASALMCTPESRPFGNRNDVVSRELRPAPVPK